MTFDLDTFIRESNLIDAQFDINGILIPGAKPGDPMYDNQLAAWAVAQDYAISENIPNTVALDIHRALTKGIDFFELRNMSGQYRRCGVRIGWENCPSFNDVPGLMDKIWYPILKDIHVQQPLDITDIKNTLAAELFESLGWYIHNLFECIHPFIDGNGRTGRLLLNLVCTRYGIPPVIVEYDQRQDYYRQIQSFRERIFNQYLENYRELESNNQ